MEIIGSGLGGGGFNANDKNLIADISPTSLALNLYVRSQGHNTDPKFYWKENLITAVQRQKEEEEKQEADEKAQRQEAILKKDAQSS